MPWGFYIVIGLIVVILIILITQIKVVPQAQVFVVERIGSYYQTWTTGLHFLVPFIDRVAKRVSLKEHVVDFKPQPVITKDNVTMQIDTVVFYQVTDAKLFTYGINNPMSAIENLTATTLRNIVGELELDATLTSRDTVNSKITSILDQATDKWGIKVTRVELKHSSAARDSGRDGAPDEGGARTPREYFEGGRREALADPCRRGREGIADSARTGRKRGDHFAGGRNP